MEPSVTITLYDAKAILDILKIRTDGGLSFIGRLSDAIDAAECQAWVAVTDRPDASAYAVAYRPGCSHGYGPCACRSTDDYHSCDCPRYPTDASHSAGGK